MPSEPKRKLAAIMFTDMVGYTSLMQKDEGKARKLIERHRDLMKPHVDKHGGEIIQYVGDGTFCRFDSAIEAVNAALEIQHVLLLEDDMSLRIGIHVGDVVIKGDEVYGDGVNVASRLEPLAEAGGICLSGEVYTQIKNHPDIDLVAGGSKELKNVKDPIDIYFVGVSTVEKRSVSEETQKSEKSIPRKYIYSGAAVIAILLIVLWNLPFFSSGDRVLEASGEIRSIAVLPLENLSGDPDKEYFSDGMTEALIADIAKIRALRVISRTSIMRYKGTDKSLPEIAKELNVDAILEGSVLLIGDEVRITAQLIRAATDELLWAESYIGNIENVFSLQAKIAKAIANEIKITLTPEEKNRLESVRKINPEALEAYLKGKFFWNKRTADDISKALEFYKQAIGKDPTYALAFVGMAESYNLLHEYAGIPSSETYPKAVAAANEALKLDPKLGEAHISLAYAYHEHYWDWEKAEAEFLKGLELNPNYATGRQWYAEFLARQGRFEEALVQVRKSRELDPLAMVIHANEGFIEYLSGNRDKGLKLLKSVSQLYPNSYIPNWLLSLIYRGEGNEKEAYKYTMKYIRFGGFPTEFIESVEEGFRDSGLVGMNRAFLESLISLDDPDPSLMSQSYGFLGEYEKAIDWLEELYDQKDVWITGIL
ncbi:MAG: hypothetical protein IIB94_08915, partial [Candidatus Marinimicrobia bacterium]|nr:hypothetical protein [Candidatus Neomarinimicrobiota bacterium]